MFCLRKVSLLATTAVLLVAPAGASAILIFDTFDPFASTGVFVGADDKQGGDHMIVPSTGPGLVWQVNRFTGHYGTTAAGTYTNTMATLTFYRTVSVTGTGPAFSAPLGSATRNLGGITTFGPGEGVDFNMTGLNILLHSAPTDPGLGYGVKIEFSTTGPGEVVPHYVDQSSTITGSSSTDGWFRDLNDDGSLTADEYETFVSWTDGNLYMEIDASTAPVPEPASLFGLLAAGGLFVAKRRSKKAKA